jgi:hypothetical protein
MINILRQQAQLDQKAAKAASKMTASKWADSQDEFWNAPENALRSPISGKPLTSETTDKDREKLLMEAKANPIPGGGPLGTPAPQVWPQPLPGGVEKLLSQTGDKAAEADRQFDEHFGPGAAKRARGPEVPASR